MAKQNDNKCSSNSNVANVVAIKQSSRRAFTMKREITIYTILVLILVELASSTTATADVSSSNYYSGSNENLDSLTACQHLRRAETRRAKALGDNGSSVRIPKCARDGDFERIQCSNDIESSDECWCVDEYGLEIIGTRTNDKNNVTCEVETECPASSCRMFCPAGFARDLRSGCSICKCRDPCEGLKCPRGTDCQPMNVKCRSEPCPPVPSCRKAKSLSDLCPYGQPLPINGEIRPFLCGLDPGKPTCPPLYKCLVQSGNDYGVCCPASVNYEKPGMCPAGNGPMQVNGQCGGSCRTDIECPQMQKCCFNPSCGQSCQQPMNITVCHQVKLLSEVLSINEREGRGYIPDCSGPNGNFASKQCSRNALVCWCVEPINGNKIEGTMGAANIVNCENVQIQARSSSRSLDGGCDKHICAAVCEYGFKNDHNGCPTCECSEPCENFKCPMGTHCEVAVDAECYDSNLCSSEPVCKPNLVYSNPCEIGVPLADNTTSELLYCHQVLRESREYQQRSFWDEDSIETGARSLSNTIECPSDYDCIKLHKEPGSVCCPTAQESTVEDDYDRQQSMCEYLRDFTERMEGTEEGMTLAITAPTCKSDGLYEAMQCRRKMVQVKASEEKRLLEDKSIREMRKLFAESRSIKKKRRSVGSDAKQMERSAKIIDKLPSDLADQSLTSKTRKRRPADMVAIELEECWCVDGFGTEIPKTRSDNTTIDYCNDLREQLECLDVTCRMACDYGFILDPVTRCPSCECRSPCDDVECGEGHECRIVEVSCENEYCPPVPACMPRKPGQCPYLVPPGYDNLESDSCDFECRSDYHCDGSKRCCSNGCGTQCVEPELKTACQHLQSLQMHQSIELGVPAKDKYIAQCNEDGGFKTVQCGPSNMCWCVDEYGKEKSGTRTTAGRPNCEIMARSDCGVVSCPPCEHGYDIDENGCKTCQCKEPCNDISCPRGEKCELIKVECTDQQFCSLPICTPIRDSVCMEGLPFKIEGRELMCGPDNDLDSCPSTHTCQIDPVTKRGVCCPKTRDSCFESLSSTCNPATASGEIVSKWRFSPKHNKCIPFPLPKHSTGSCQTKNMFDSDFACNAVCPVLSQCERLKLKNSLVAKRSGQASSAWFQPRCDDETGSWNPVQCLGDTKNDTSNMRVCWCADKKGAPIKGSLVKGAEPICNHRQARRRLDLGTQIDDPFMEELIRQVTFLSDDSNHLGDGLDEEFEAEQYITTMKAITEQIKTVSTTTITNQLSEESAVTELPIQRTRCHAISQRASFDVSCDDNGAFVPTQCSKSKCWCVDEAGNQVTSAGTFMRGSKVCEVVPIDSVEVELLLKNEKQVKLVNLYDVIRKELSVILDSTPFNLRVKDNEDDTIIVKFDLLDEHKVDQAYSLEEAIRKYQVSLYNRNLMPEITDSTFIHKASANSPTTSSLNGLPQNPFHTVVFILATTSAFIVSLFVIYVMLKRGKTEKNYDSNKAFVPMNDKNLDYTSPIFVLSPEDKRSIKSTHD